jgi:hypothetical protein
LPGVGDGSPGGVVVVAEVFCTEAGAAAAVAFGEDVAALILFGGWCGVLHGWGPSPVKCVQSLLKKRPASGLLRCRSRVKCEGPACGRASLFSYYFYFRGLSETKIQSLANLFMACKGCGLLGFRVSIFESGGFWGLTYDF